MFDMSALLVALNLIGSSLDTWLWVVPGIAIGLFFGAMPGISITMAMALTLPLTLYMDFLSAIIFLTSVYTGAGYGGSVPAVLINIPGTSAAVATTFDGYPMARKGMHNEALGGALGASVIGSVISYTVLLFLESTFDERLASFHSSNIQRRVPFLSSLLLVLFLSRPLPPLSLLLPWSTHLILE